MKEQLTSMNKEKKTSVTAIKRLRELLELASEFKVSELEIDGMRIVIDVPAQMMTSRKTTGTLSDQDDKVNEVKRTLEDLIAQEKSDELWST